MKLGAQLYTVRQAAGSLEALDSTLARVAQIGYTTVQVSGTCDYDPAWMRDTLAKYGLRCVLTHKPAAAITEDTDGLVAQHRVYGCPYIGLGGMPHDMRGSLDGVNRFRAAFAKAAQQISAGGGRFFYHNHAFEMEKFEGKTALEWIAALFPAQELSFTLDTYWIQAGGGDPAAWIRKFAGRVQCVHLKDMAAGADNAARMRPIYEGNMDFDGIIAACRESGVEYLLVEQDDTYGEDPFDCLQRSFDNVIAKYPELR